MFNNKTVTEIANEVVKEGKVEHNSLVIHWDVFKKDLGAGKEGNGLMIKDIDIKTTPINLGLLLAGLAVTDPSLKRAVQIAYSKIDEGHIVPTSDIKL